MIQRPEQRNLPSQWNLSRAPRKRLHDHAQIVGAAAGQILRGHPLCQRPRNAPLPMAERVYGAVRWTKQGGPPWLLLGLLVCTSIVRGQTAGFDRQVVEIVGTVVLEGGNRPIGGVIVSIRSLAGGPFASILTDSNGHFQVQGLNPGRYEILVEEAGYEPTRETLQLYGPSPPFGVYLKPSNPSRASWKDYSVSARELRIPGKARNSFEKGLERLAKNDAAGGRTQFVRATTAFPDYYEAYYHLGVADLRSGREEEAAQAFQKAIDLSGGHYAWAQFAMGLLLCRRGEHAQAEAVIRKGLEVDGTSATGHLFLGVALFRMNRLEEAEQSAREALLMKPRFACPYLVLADVHSRRGEYAMQLHDLDAYLKLEPDGPATKRVREIRAVVQRIAFRTKDRE